MRYPWLDGYLMAKAGVSRDFKAEWNWTRYKLGEKMFAALCFGDNGEAVYITLKLTPREGELLRREYPDIIPGYYMNKQHWNSVRADGSVPDEVLRTMLDRAYVLVLDGLSRKAREALRQGEG